MIDPATLPALPGLVSTARLGRAASRYGGRVDLALRTAAWETELTTAFWGPVAWLEVFVRNALHDAMRRRRRDDWWNEPSVALLDREKRQLERALASLYGHGHPEPTADQVVAALSFGFWVGLTDAGIPRHPRLSYETAMWQPRLVRAFPHLGAVRRKQLHRRLDDVRRFRNRLAHHEPIRSAPLGRIRDDLLAVAGYIHPDAAAFIAGAHRIDEAFARQEAAIGSGACVI